VLNPTNSLWAPPQCFGFLHFPATRVAGGSLTPVELNTTVHVTAYEAFDAFLAAAVARREVQLGMAGPSVCLAGA